MLAVGGHGQRVELPVRTSRKLTAQGLMLAGCAISNASGNRPAFGPSGYCICSAVIRMPRANYSSADSAELAAMIRNGTNVGMSDSAKGRAAGRGRRRTSSARCGIGRIAEAGVRYTNLKIVNFFPVASDQGSSLVRAAATILG